MAVLRRLVESVLGPAPGPDAEYATSDAAIAVLREIEAELSTIPYDQDDPRQLALVAAFGDMVSVAAAAIEDLPGTELASEVRAAFDRENQR